MSTSFTFTLRSEDRQRPLPHKIIIGLDQTMFQEVCSQIQDRNEFLLVSLSFSPSQWQFDLNNLWFDAPFTILRH